jgi:hypothetical protein
LDLGKVSKLIFLMVIFLIINSSNISAQVHPIGTKTSKIDSLLSKYHLEGVKIFIKKLGVISINEKRVTIKRGELNNRLLIKMQKKLSFNEEGVSAEFDYKFTTHWLLRGESYHRNWGQQSGVSMIYQIEY